MRLRPRVMRRVGVGVGVAEAGAVRAAHRAAPGRSAVAT